MVLRIRLFKDPLSEIECQPCDHYVDDKAGRDGFLKLTDLEYVGFGPYKNIKVWG